MSMQVTLTLSNSIYRRAQRIAQLKQRDIADVLVESITLANIDEIDNTAQPELDQAIEQERAAYLALHPQLLNKYKGEYVAVYQGKVIDHAPTFSSLYARISQQYPDTFVLIRPVEDVPERVYRFRSPRLVKNQ